jgi:hypothetical protein
MFANFHSSLCDTGAEYEESLPAPNKHLDSPNRAKIGKSIRDIEKLLASQGGTIPFFNLVVHPVKSPTRDGRRNL